MAVRRGTVGRVMRVAGLALVVLFLASAGAVAQDRLIIAQGTDVEHLDPHGVASTPSAVVTQHIYDTLFDLDANSEVVPRLATDWSVSDDGLVWTLTLRRGVRFTDGTPFDAQVVKFNLERLLDPQTDVPLRSYINMVDHVEVVDDYTVQVVLHYPHAPFLHRLTAATNAMVSPEAVERWGEDFSRHPTGTGPYRLQQWIPGDRLILERNPDYWGEPPEIRFLEFRPVPEDSTRVVLLESGDVDVIVRVPPVETSRLESNPDIAVTVAPSTREIYVGMNTTVPALRDVRVRQALNYAVDKEAIVANILRGAGRVVDAPILQEMFGYAPVGAYAYDPERARSLLAEAGYADGLTLTLHTPQGRYLQDRQIAEAIQGYLADVGVTVQIRTVEWATYLSFVRRPIEETATELFLLGWGPWILDGDQMVYPMFRTDQWPPAGSNYGFYSNPRVDELIQVGTSSTDTARRQTAYREAQEIIMDEAPWIFLHNEQQIVAWRTNVTGVRVLPIEQLRFEKARFE